jgi:hypothetical protein
MNIFLSLCIYLRSDMLKQCAENITNSIHTTGGTNIIRFVCQQVNFNDRTIYKSIGLKTWWKFLIFSQHNHKQRENEIFWVIKWIKSRATHAVNHIFYFCHISNFVCMDVVTGGRNCPINSNKHTLQLYFDDFVAIFWNFFVT